MPTIILDPKIQKIHLLKNGEVIGSIWRRKGKPVFRGDLTLGFRTAHKIFYRDGRTVVVPNAIV